MLKRFLLALGALFLVALLWVTIATVQRQRNRDRWAAEGQAAVERFLREQPDPRLASLGAFQELQGSGWVPPVWNIQGYEFISLHRNARFERGMIRMVIHVTESRADDRSSQALGTPRIESYSPVQGAIVFIAHPELR